MGEKIKIKVLPEHRRVLAKPQNSPPRAQLHNSKRDGPVGHTRDHLWLIAGGKSGERGLQKQTVNYLIRESKTLCDGMVT